MSLRVVVAVVVVVALAVIWDLSTICTVYELHLPWFAGVARPTSSELAVALHCKA